MKTQKVKLTPRAHRLFVEAQARASIARFEDALGAWLEGQASMGATPELVAHQMMAGMAGFQAAQDRTIVPALHGKG